jgi:1-acyl-sn-glycerol-3-phosphate acyltransferase
LLKGHILYVWSPIKIFVFAPYSDSWVSFRHGKFYKPNPTPNTRGKLSCRVRKMDRKRKERYKITRTDLVYDTVKLFFRSAAKAARYDLCVEGVDEIPKKGPATIMYKHIAWYDPFTIACAIDRPVSVLAKKELYSFPPFAKFFEAVGGIKMDRSNTRRTWASLDYAMWLLDQGEILALAPEMTRTPGFTGQIHPDFVVNYLKKNARNLDRRYESIPILCAGLWYENMDFIPRYGTKIEIRMERADLGDGSLDSLADSVGRQMARLSRVEYHPERTERYLKRNAIRVT